MKEKNLTPTSDITWVYHLIKRKRNSEITTQMISLFTKNISLQSFGINDIQSTAFWSYDFPMARFSNNSTRMQLNSYLIISGLD